MFCLCLAYLCPFIHPESFKILPFFGLAYPVFFLLALVFLIGWALARSKYALIILVVILVGGKLHFRMLAMGGNKEIPSTEQNVWKIMSYNVRLFDLYNWYENDEDDNDSKRLQIFDYLKKQDADVLCFQEFYHQDNPSKFPTRNALIPLLKAVDYHERYSHKLFGRQNFGISMFSKYPMISKGDVAFDDSEGNSDNYCIFADIVKGKDTLRVYNVHLQSIKFKKDDYTVFENENYTKKIPQSALKALYEKLQNAYPKRATQAMKIMEHIKTSPYEVIICGDFNDTPMSFVYAQFNFGLTDAFRKSSKGIGTTYVGKIPAGRIDYIFHSSSLNSSNFNIQNEALSDHRAISCLIWKSND